MLGVEGVLEMKAILMGLWYFVSRVWDTAENYPVTPHEYRARHAACLKHVREFNMRSKGDKGLHDE